MVRFAVRAPSIHNTQPWRWVYAVGGLSCTPTGSGDCGPLDPDGRALVLSCGGALALAQLRLAARRVGTMLSGSRTRPGRTYWPGSGRERCGRSRRRGRWSGARRRSAATPSGGRSGRIRCRTGCSTSSCKPPTTGRVRVRGAARRAAPGPGGGDVRADQVEPRTRRTGRSWRTGSAAGRDRHRGRGAGLRGAARPGRLGPGTPMCRSGTSKPAPAASRDVTGDVDEQPALPGAAVTVGDGRSSGCGPARPTCGSPSRPTTRVWAAPR